MNNAINNAPLSLKAIFYLWLPLAISWFFMSLEQPIVSAVIARLHDAELNLAALGIVFAIALLIEAPVIMLLSASTALSVDWASYRKLRSFMMWSGGLLTLLHALVTFTPLYHLWVVPTFNIPEEIIALTRLGLMIFLPWTWSIGYRRFNQGVLIRYGHAIDMSIGTGIRLLAGALAMVLALLIAKMMEQAITGIAVGSLGVSAGVLAEAIYVGIRVRPVRSRHFDAAELEKAKPTEKSKPAEALTWQKFYSFYIPLALTPFLGLLAQPVGTAAMGRMPETIASLAIFPVLMSFIFLWRGLGFAYTEVVIANIEKARGFIMLRRFTMWMTVIFLALYILIAATPLADMWFAAVVGLEPKLTKYAKQALWWGLPWIAIHMLFTWVQGMLVHARKTGIVTESVAVFLLTITIILFLGQQFTDVMGLFVAIVAFSAGAVTQTLWMIMRGYKTIQSLHDDGALRQRA